MIRPPGQQFGDYRLMRLLGSGGFAEVYEAGHLYLPGVKAAIKVLKGSFSPQQIEDLRREALLVSTLDHPHIVRLHTFSIERTSNTPYLVMSYAQGGALDRLHPRGTRLSLPLLLLYVRQVAQALQYAHERRIVHRDLKPANLLLAMDGHVQIADFGIAVVAHGSTSRTVQEIAGTCAYMAPEQFQGRAEPASDQYSLAIMVYQWLCGNIPFDGNGNFYLISKQQIEQPPPSLREKLPDLSPNVEDVIMKALAKHPEERFASIKEFAEALEEACRPPFVPSSGLRLGDYRLVRKLGEGGFAEVYEAEHLYLGTRAAIKLLKGTFSSKQVEGLRQEARAVMQLEHPNIIRAYGFSIEQKVPYMIMAYAPGGSLAARHAPGTRLPLETILAYVRQIASALQYAHDQKVTHCDIKPENLLLTQDGRIQIADFGIAVMAQATQARQDIIGSWTYMAPEQFQGKAEPASDQYALAIMIYQWLCGEAPFTGNGNMHALFHQQMNEPPPSLGKRVPTLSPRIEQVVMKALAKKPLERFASVQAFAQALEEASIAPVVSAAQPSDKQPGTKARAAQMPPTGKQPAPKVAIPAEKPPVSANPAPPASKTSTNNKTPAAASKAPPPKVATTEVPSAQKAKSVTGSSGEAHGVAAGVGSAVPGGTAAAGRASLVYRHKGGRVNALAWSPGKTHVASGGEDATVRIWDALTGQTLLTLLSHTGWVTAVAWSADGRLLASGSADNTVQVWDVASGTLLCKYTGHASVVNVVAWSTNGRLIVSGSDDKTVQVWEAVSGTQLYKYTGHSSRVTTVAWLADELKVASGSADKTVQVWMALSGALRCKYTGHADQVNAVMWSANGQQIASCSDDKTVQVWEATSGKVLRRYEGHTSRVITLAWSAGGRQIASGGKDKTVQIWEAASGKLLHKYTGHSGPVHAVAWSTDERLLVSSSGDKTVQVWEAVSRKLLRQYEEHSNRVSAVAWSTDGRRIASGSDDKTVQVWDAVSGTLLCKYTGHAAAVNTVAWSVDGQQIASAGNNKTVQVWEAASGKLVRLYEGHSNNVTTVAWAVDGQQIASGSVDKTVQLWDVASGTSRLKYTGHTDAVRAVAWSSGRLIASGGEDKTVQVWEAASGKLLRKYTGHTSPVNVVAWSADGRQIASGSNDKTVHIWEAASGKLLYRYEGHSDYVTALAWSADGRLLASASRDKTVQVWEAATGKLLFTYRGHFTPIYAMAWSADGTRIASAGYEVHVW